MKDFTSKAPKEKDDMNIEELAMFREYELLRSMNAYNDEFDEEKQERLQLLDKYMCITSAQRKSNEDVIIKFTNTLFLGAALPIMECNPSRVMAPLKRGESREFRMIASSSGDMERISIIVGVDGTRAWELPRKVIDGVRQHKTLHAFLDQGVKGQPAFQFMKFAPPLRMTINWDVFHQIHNALADACAEAGLMVVRMGFRQCMSMRKGAWNNNATHVTLKQVTKHLRDFCNHENAYFQFLMDDFLRTIPLLRHHPAFGSAEHQRWVWEWVLCRLEGMSCVGDAKTSMWWRWEQCSREQAPDRFVNLFALLVLGDLRKWWSSIQSCPLFTTRMGALPENEHPVGPDVDEPAAAAAPVAAGKTSTDKSPDEGAQEGRDGKEKSKQVVNTKTARLHVHHALLRQHSGARPRMQIVAIDGLPHVAPRSLVRECHHAGEDAARCAIAPI